MSISDGIALLGGIALFLFGMSLMGDGLKRVAGNKLELILYQLSSTPIRGILLGTGVTAVIQSSSATSVMVVGFVNSGMMKVRQAIGIVLGAILGTSVTGWIICLSDLSGGSGWVQLLSTATLTGIIAVIGIILRMFTKGQSTRHVGDILLGFAVLMYGMSAMSGAVSPLRESEAFIQVLTSFSNPLLGILVGLVFTSVLQSASAAIGILQALSVTGAISFGVALPIVMDILGVVIWGGIFYGVNAVVHFTFLGTTMTTVSIALMNTLFRLATVIALTPMIGLLEKIVCMLFPERDATPEEQDMDRLEARFLQHPALAIEQSRLVTCSMAQKAQMNLLDAMSLRHDYSDEGFERVEKLEGIVDRYEDRLGTYLVQITRRELLDRQNEDVSKFLHTITDFERISDHALNIAEACRELHEKDVAFSPEAEHELDVMESAIREIVSIAIRAFTENDLHLAGRVEPLEEIVDGLCDQLKSRHVGRLQQGVCTLKLGFVFNDLLTNYERVADHCSNIAVALIELESDVFDTHAYLNSVHELKSETFDRYYDEYQKKFAI